MAARHSRSPMRLVADLVGLAVLVVSVFPVYWMVSRSFLPQNRIKSDEPTWFPASGTLGNYDRILAGDGFRNALVTSLSVTLLTVAAALLFAFLAAVAVSRFRFRGRTS